MTDSFLLYFNNNDSPARADRRMWEGRGRRNFPKRCLFIFSERNKELKKKKNYPKVIYNRYIWIPGGNLSSLVSVFTRQLWAPSLERASGTPTIIFLGKLILPICRPLPSWHLWMRFYSRHFFPSILTLKSTSWLSFHLWKISPWSIGQVKRVVILWNFQRKDQNIYHKK